MFVVVRCQTRPNQIVKWLERPGPGELPQILEVETERLPNAHIDFRRLSRRHGVRKETKEYETFLVDLALRDKFIYISCFPLHCLTSASINF